MSFFQFIKLILGSIRRARGTYYFDILRHDPGAVVQPVFKAAYGHYDPGHHDPHHHDHDHAYHHDPAHLAYH